MVKHVIYWSTRISAIFALIILHLPAFSQNITDTLTLKQNITSSSVDRVGNLYLAFEDGTITQLNSKLDSIVSFNPTQAGEVTLLEAWHGFQIFAFYEEYQEYQLLNRFLTQETRYDLSDLIPDYVNLCTFSNNQNLWVFNEAGFKLMKINTFTREVLIDNPLEFLINEDEAQIIFMKEYQNKLFLLTKDSILYIFDNLGNYLNKIEASQIIDFCFKKNTLFYLGTDSYTSLNLYTGSQTTTAIPAGDYHQIELLGNDTLLLIKKNMIYLTKML